MGDLRPDSELNEQFHAVMEEIKYEDTKIMKEINDVDITPCISSENYNLPKSEPLPMMCRFCMSRTNVMVYIFGPVGRNANIIEKIDDCLPVTVKKTDNLPKQVCRMCLDKLEQFYQFRQRAAEAEMVFLLMLEGLQIPSEDDTTVKYTQTAPLGDEQRATNKDVNDGKELKTSSHENASNDESGAIHEEPEASNVAAENSSSLRKTILHSEELSTVESCGENKLEKENQTRRKKDEDLSMNDVSSGKKSAAASPVKKDVFKSMTQSSKQMPILKKELRSDKRTHRSKLRYSPPITRSKRASTTQAVERVEEDNIDEDNIVEDNIVCEEVNSEVSSPPSINSVEVCDDMIVVTEKEEKSIEAEKVEERTATHECNECKEKFDTVVRLKFHKLRHEVFNAYKEYKETIEKKRKLEESKNAPKEPITFSCDKCGEKFDTNKELRIHKRTHPKLRKSVKKEKICFHCGKAFAQKGHLIAHIRSHTGERPHNCFICSKTFATLSTLNYHIKGHKSERPYQCLICDKAFIYKSGLKQHAVTHSSEKPFQCTECDLWFPTRAHRTAHMHAHIVGRPHQCDLCECCYKYKRNLRYHKRTRHGETGISKFVVKYKTLKFEK